MRERDKELIKACREGNMYDYISNNAYQFTKEELVDILKQTYYAVYQRLQNQNKEVEQLIPHNLDDYGFFDDSIYQGNDEQMVYEGYYEYLAGILSYETYLRMCKKFNQEPEPAK